MAEEVVEDEVAVECAAGAVLVVAAVMMEVECGDEVVLVVMVALVHVAVHEVAVVITTSVEISQIIISIVQKMINEVDRRKCPVYSM